MVEGQGVYKRYLAYKDSGVPWLGEIPEHWELKKLKHLFFEKKKISNPNLNCGAISFGQVVTKDDEKIPMATKASYQEVLKGEFLINPLNLNYDLISLRIALSNIDVVVSPGYIVLKNLVEINKSYFNWLLHIYDVAYMKLLCSGVRQTITLILCKIAYVLFGQCKKKGVLFRLCKITGVLFPKSLQTGQ
jgi:type I restriction enzyme S subunit